MKNIALVVALVGLAAQAGETDLSALEKLNAEEMTHVIRPGWENGGEWWNANASTFIYPPAFGYMRFPNAVKYVFTITDDVGHLLSFEAPTPNEPLTNVWPKVATGLTTVMCNAVGKDGESVGLAGWSFFWKGAPFKPGSYPKAKRSYAESAAKVYEYVFNMEPMQKCLKEGRPDPAYMLNCYPTKIHASVISGMVRYAKAVPEKAADAMKLARILADYLQASTEPKGAPLEGFPPTYETHEAFKHWTAKDFEGQTMLLYPAAGGRAYLELYAATGEKKYREAAIAIAERYLALQGEDGSWYLKLYLKDGKPVTANRCLPIGIAEFLEAVHAETKDAKYRTAADRAFAYVEKRPLRDWNWEGQFEDVKPTAKYVNLTKHPAGEAAIYMMKRFPTDVKRQALARELLRFCEDQFVCWERPCRPDGTGFKTGRDWIKPGDVTADYGKWLDFPSALEQYYWYIPIDASNAKMINTYLALYRATKNPLDLAKARALGDTLTRVQLDSGRIPTEMAEYKLKDPMTDWVNCMLAAARSLENLAKED